MRINFTKHAEEKFSVLARHDVLIKKREVINAIINPDILDYSRAPLLIAQRSFDKNHVLRVVYKKEYGKILVITFYPGRKSQYEKQKQ